jgi:2-octaprenyl-6-methoxyphenol hydroxylase
MSLPVAILGGGPAGLLTALLLAQARVRSVVADARALDQARADPRLLALSRGTLQILAPVVALPERSLGPIRTVQVCSAGQFGAALIREDELGGEWLGATVRYGDLVAALDAAAAACADRIDLRRPARVAGVAQQAAGVRVTLDDGGVIEAAIAVHAEGLGGAPRVAPPPSQVALIGEVQVEGVPAGRAVERFTREGPLALLPLPGEGGPGTRWMSLVWCMPAAAASARQSAPDAQLCRELQAALGSRIAQVRALRGRAAYPLHEVARGELVEGRSVYLGNAAQTLHPVAGQGFNLAVRDARELALRVAQAAAAGADLHTALAPYAAARRADRAALLAVTRTMPGFFASRRWPVPLARGLGLAALTALPAARLALARLLMFGVRL